MKEVESVYFVSFDTSTKGPGLDLLSIRVLRLAVTCFELNIKIYSPRAYVCVCLCVCVG